MGIEQTAQLLVHNLLKKNTHFGAKSRKQRTGIFLAFQIYGSKGSYRQNIESMEVMAIPGRLRFHFGTAEVHRGRRFRLG